MSQVRTAHAAVAGLSASLVGIGLGRFAYTPLIPVLIGAQWFAPQAVIYLGAANLAGYLVGALAARPVGERQSPARVLRCMMLLSSAAFFASVAPVSLAWFGLWRFVAGVTGGVIMVLAAPSILAHTDPRRRGLIGGMIFTGVGLGIAASGTLVPLLLRLGLPATWFGLGVVCTALTVLAWAGWPEGPAPAGPPPGAAARISTLPVNALLLEYGLNAVGLVPHMVFLVDFIARGLGDGLAAGAAYWVVYGLGALGGPLLAGAVADRIGFRDAFRATFVVQAVVVALPIWLTGPGWLALSALVAGACTPGVVPLALGRVHELLPHDHAAQRVVWGRTTIAWALFQATGAYLDSWLFGATGDYRVLFGVGCAALLLALLIDLGAGWSGAARSVRGSSAS